MKIQLKKQKRWHLEHGCTLAAPGVLFVLQKHSWGSVRWGCGQQWWMNVTMAMGWSGRGVGHLWAKESYGLLLQVLPMAAGEAQPSCAQLCMVLAWINGLGETGKLKRDNPVREPFLLSHWCEEVSWTSEQNHLCFVSCRHPQLDQGCKFWVPTDTPETPA